MSIIVASMGGTAGIQALTVAVRAIAMKELTETNALRNIRPAKTAKPTIGVAKQLRRLA